MCSPCHSDFKTCPHSSSGYPQKAGKGLVYSFLRWKNWDPLEKEMATHSSILAWKIPWTEKPGRLQSMGSQRVGYDWAHSHTHTHTHTHTRENNWRFKILCQISHRATLRGLSWAIQVTAPSRNQHCPGVPVTSKYLNITTNWTPKCSR